MERFLSALTIFLAFNIEKVISAHDLNREFCSFDGSNQHLTYICSVEDKQNLFRCTYSNLQRKNIYNISFQNCNISKLSEESFDELRGNPEVKEIDLSGVSLKWLGDSTFKYFPNMVKLNISNNEFAHFADISFTNLNKLETLDMSFNDLNDLNGQVFYNLKELRHLNLSNINLSHLNFESLSFLMKLVSLNLSQNHIKIIDMGTWYWDTFSNLQRIDLKSNGMIELNTFRPALFPQLTFLDLRYNNFNCSRLKSALDPFNHLNELNLPSDVIPDEKSKQAYRGISCKPSPSDQGRVDYKCTSTDNINVIIVTCGHTFERQNAFGYYHEFYSNCEFYRTRTNIEIQFQNCSMSDIPTEAINQIGYENINAMDVSNLDGNSLNSSYFVTLNLLHKLIGKHNRLQDLEEKIFISTDLDSLDIAHNEFSNVESIGRSGANELKVLNMSNNKIIELNVMSFSGLDHLEELDLSFNYLSIIHGETFDMLKELKNLSLAHTHLIQIDFGLLSHLENLQSLDFSATPIRKVEIGSHSGLFTSLQKINMSASKITEIDGLTPTIFPSLIYLDLSRNPINCSHLESIVSSFDSHRLRLKPDPSSKIIKGESYRGVACVPAIRKSEAAINEKKETSSHSTHGEDKSGAIHAVIKALETNILMITVLLLISIIVFSVFGFILYKMQKQIKTNTSVINVKRSPMNDDELEFIQSSF